MIRQFRQIEAVDCEWVTSYLLCKDVIFNWQMLDKQISDLGFQALNCDKIIGQGHDLCHPKLVQNEYLKTFNMTYSIDKVIEITSTRCI